MKIDLKIEVKIDIAKVIQALSGLMMMVAYLINIL